MAKAKARSAAKVMDLLRGRGIALRAGPSPSVDRMPHSLLCPQIFEKKTMRGLRWPEEPLEPE